MDPAKLRRTGFGALASMTGARSGFLARVQPFPRVLRVPLDAALGRVLATAVDARVPVPSFTKSAMDGYAIVASDSFGASVQAPRGVHLDGVVAIGDEPAVNVASGRAARVATGSMIPPGADAVIKIEDTGMLDGGTVQLYKPIPPGTNIIPAGEDYGAGQRVLQQGRRLRPQDIGVLATLGHASVPVFDMPRIVVLATGNELVALDSLQAGEDGVVDTRQAGACKLVDSNRHAISALVREAGGTVIRSELLQDDEATIGSRIEAALDAADMVITTGGTSIGERDFLPVVMGRDHEILFHGIAMKPGGATLLGMARGKPVIGLSGFPVAAEMGMACFGAPAVRKLAGDAVLDPRPVVPARLAIVVAVKGFGYTRLLRVALHRDDPAGDLLPSAVPLKLGGSGMQRSMVESDGVVEIPPDVEGYEAGDVVQVKLHWP